MWTAQSPAAELWLAAERRGFAPGLWLVSFQLKAATEVRLCAIWISFRGL